MESKPCNSPRMGSGKTGLCPNCKALLGLGDDRKPYAKCACGWYGILDTIDSELVRRIVEQWILDRSEPRELIDSKDVRRIVDERLEKAGDLFAYHPTGSIFYDPSEKRWQAEAIILRNKLEEAEREYCQEMKRANDRIKELEKIVALYEP